MRKYFFSLLILFSVLGQAQIGESFKFNNAKRLMSLGSFDEARKVLDTLKMSHPTRYNLDFLIGQCYLNLPDQSLLAIPYLETAILHTSTEYQNQWKQENASEWAFLDLSKAFLLANRLDESISTAQKGIEKTKDAKLKTELELVMSNAHNAKDLMLLPIEIQIEPMPVGINTVFDEYNALFSADESFMIFTSRRSNSTGGLRNDQGKYYEDIYQSVKENGLWTEPVSVGNNVNTERHESAVALSPDGKQMILFRDDFGIGNLYQSYRDSSGWSKPEILSKNINISQNQTHAAFADDSETLYFISEKPDGVGGKDIYVSKRLPDGNWGMATILGPEINTTFDEEAVFVHPDGQKLYFSSKGHKSMGGFDMFYCDRMGDSTWSAPKNMGYPINTTNDDVFAVYSVDGKRAYYAANKPQGKGGFDIYTINLMSMPERNNTIVRAYLRQMDGSVAMQVPVLKVFDKSDQLIGNFKPNKAGQFTLVLRQGETYQFSAEGFEFDQKLFVVPQESSFYITQKALDIESLAKVLNQ